MKSNLASWSRVQKLAWTQIALIALQLLAGIWILINTSAPEPGVDASVNTFSQIAVMIFGVFLIPAIPVVQSAMILVKPSNEVTPQQIHGAWITQKFVFGFCVLMVLPALQLGLMGFWVFFVDCVLGFIFWFVLRSELQSKETRK